MADQLALRIRVGAMRRDPLLKFLDVKATFPPFHGEVRCLPRLIIARFHGESPLEVWPASPIEASTPACRPGAGVVLGRCPRPAPTKGPGTASTARPPAAGLQQ